jgi:hypothetical protein
MPQQDCEVTKVEVDVLEDRHDNEATAKKEAVNANNVSVFHVLAYRHKCRDLTNSRLAAETGTFLLRCKSERH